MLSFINTVTVKDVYDIINAHEARVQGTLKNNSLSLSLFPVLPTCTLRAAPEVIKAGEVSLKSDVWSFGVLLWEMFSHGEVPWANYNGMMVSKNSRSSRCIVHKVPLAHVRTKKGSVWLLGRRR